MSEAVVHAPARGGLAARMPVIGVLAAVAVLAFVASLLVGPAGIGFPGGGDAARVIFWEIRLPRALLGALVGGALGLSGAVLQGYLRNPLAEPGLLGISGGAALGAVVAIHTGAAGAFAIALPAGGLLGAAVAAMAVMLLAGERSGPITLILAGVAISSLAGALTTLALNLSPNPFALVEMLFWLLGSLTDRSLIHVWLAAPLILLGGALLLTTGRALDALTLGEDAAQNLGVDLSSLRNRIVAGTALSVGAATAVAGTIGFVGLVVPHLLRPLVGHEPQRLLPASALGGAALILAADVALRLFAPLSEVRLGVVTALVGAPFFVWLILKTRAGAGAMTATLPDMLSARGVGVRLAGRRVLDAVDLSVEPGEIVAVIGANGAGKSTLLRAMAGLIAPHEGAVTLGGRPLADLDARALGREIAYLPQDRTVHWPLTVRRLVALGRLPFRARVAAPSTEDRDAVEEAMAAMDVTAFADRAVTELSGGERARVLLARALAQRPRFLVADEPTTGLDPAHGLTLFAQFVRMASQRRAVIVALHDLSLAARYCDRALLLKGGRTLALGTARAVLTPQHLAQAYGVRATVTEIEGRPVVLPIEPLP